MGNLLKSFENIFGYSIKIYKTKILPAYLYPSDYQILKVSHQGNIKWMGSVVYICYALAGENVAIKNIDDHYYEVYFRSKLIKKLDRFRRTVI